MSCIDFIRFLHRVLNSGVGLFTLEYHVFEAYKRSKYINIQTTSDVVLVWGTNGRIWSEILHVGIRNPTCRCILDVGWSIVVNR